MVRAEFTGKQLLIVCDTSTHAALGAKLMQELTPFAPNLLILEDRPHADDKTIQHIRAQPYDALIAVGSGTISDLCKYASYLDKKPYVVFPTAPSMNGYLSANASITVNGHKQSLAAHLPNGVFCDLGVLAAAPRRLIRSGLGDSLCRCTAQADWLLSHLLLNTPYTSLPFELLMTYESELFVHADKLISGDMHVVELLIKTLLISGLGMVIAKGSYPASEGEHLIAHTMEMKYGNALPETYHGEQIGVTTLSMAQIQEELLSRKLYLYKHDKWEAAIAAYFGASLAESVTKSSWNKYLLYDRYDEINERLKTNESDIRDTIREIIVPEATLREVLIKAGAPTTASELGWNRRDYKLAIPHARFIRDRFTFLDLL
jgi:glycerol-1-phosphate dehydrogenase [NAD(P)+]